MTAPKDSTAPSAAGVLEAAWHAIGARDWQSLEALLDESLEVEFMHTGELIRGASAFVRFNRDYPGDWSVSSCSVRPLSAHEAVSEVCIDLPATRYWAVSFATVRNGRILRMREYWLETQQPPAHRQIIAGQAG